MKHIYLNLKRFDISPEHGGVNRLASMQDWAGTIVKNTQAALGEHENCRFVQFYPEAHLLTAIKASSPESPVQFGCQGVYRDDTSPGGNFGAFTTNLTANAAAEMGCRHVLIGHCEERRDKLGILEQAGVVDTGAVNRLLNAEIKAAQKADLEVLYCIGETSEEQAFWEKVLHDQLSVGLEGIDLGKVVIAYEPVWSIGPGKTPPDEEYIKKVSQFVKRETNGCPVVYGGGLKEDNARMLASIDEVDGGLIALTRFSGEVGFYPEEYLAIISEYLKGCE